jgi:hypothetical protein
VLNRLTLVGVILALVVAPLAGGVACGVCGGGDKAELPVLNIGDQIAYKVMEVRESGEEDEYQVSYEVTGEEVLDGKDCYVTEATMDPAPEGLSNVEGTVWIEKATTWPLKSVITADVEYGGQVISVSFTEDLTHEFSGESYWPLEVGKEVEVTETTVETTQVEDGDPDVGDPKEKTTTYKVEGNEERTVEAGTFDCFKVVEYDEDGNKIGTAWYSDEAKVDVYGKDYDEDGEESGWRELVSYSLG